MDLLNRAIKIFFLGTTLIMAMACPGFSQRPSSRFDGFNPITARRGVLVRLSARLYSDSFSPISSASVDFQIADGASWRSISDGMTISSNITDDFGSASVDYLPPDDIQPGDHAIRVVYNGNQTYAATTAESRLTIAPSRCIDEGAAFDCTATWEAIRVFTHTTGPGIPLVLVHGNGSDGEENRADYFRWGTFRNYILQSSAYGLFDVFVWKHDTARAIGFNGQTGNAADLADYVNNHLLPRYTAGTRIVFVAHSRGGLVVRSFMNYRNQGSRVHRLITLATPHHGSPLAVPDWVAMIWASILGNTPSLFDPVFSFSFDAERMGSLNLAWDNLDEVLNGTQSLDWTSTIAIGGRMTLTPADANRLSDAADPSVFYPESLKAAFGTLADLNAREQYSSQIIRYGAYDDALADNDSLINEKFRSLNGIFSLASDPHAGLQAFTGILSGAHLPLSALSGGGARYYANDGLVPLQSALLLDVSRGTAFSESDAQRRIQLRNVSVDENCGAAGASPVGSGLYRVWSGSKDGIRDHLDVIQTSNVCYWQALTLDITSAIPSALLTLQYGLQAPGGTSTVTTGEGAAPNIGYARIQPSSGNRAPSGFAIFDFRIGGVLVTETAVQASAMVSRGRIYAENGAVVRTGFAMANPGTSNATISFFFTDQSGRDSHQGTFTIPAGGQLSKFLDESPFNIEPSIGSFTFDSNVPVSALALRGLINERGDFLITTLPVVPLTNPSNAPIVIPQFADGAGWATQILLVNPTDSAVAGTLQFFSPGTETTPGQPLSLSVNGQTANTFAYSVQPRSSATLQTAGTATELKYGWARISPSSGSTAPVALGIYRYRSGGVTVSETGVLGQASGSNFGLYVETSGTSGSALGRIQSGLAVANASSAPVTVTLDLTDLNGAATGLSSTLVIPAQGQIARFLTEIPGFQNLASSVQGVLRIRSASASPVAVIGLRGRYNERADFLITSTPPLNLNVAQSNEELIIPDFVDGGGYTTQFVLFNGDSAAVSGRVVFLDRNGQPLPLALR